jgi:hypothetical protein
MIEPKDILDWCFTLASLDFGVFGFLYSVYATASFQATPEHPVRPPITQYLKRFCQAVVAVLIVLTLLAAFTSYTAAAECVNENETPEFRNDWSAAMLSASAPCGTSSGR